MSIQYSILFSTNSIGFPYIKDRLKCLVSADYKVVVFPWAFPIEMSDKEFTEGYFPRYGERYECTIGYLREIGIKDENIFIANCYNDSVNQIKKEIDSSNIIVLPGGNPVMLSTKILECGIQDELKNYTNIIIGGSAGACIQFKKYFITEENNRPRGFQELQGLGILDVDFLIDVHTNIHTTGENQEKHKSYINKLKVLAKNYNKDIYAISDDGAIFVDRKTNQFEMFGNVEKITID
ncbi:Type 1 glutamine amidotransferase-like domain-containing protein [Clostridium sp. CS001]|uniref:Type 1 glutamine amidotransferase-like domain-containing protein n=1 Tax=Clostridium sp. CS001 TaxID=2880648 RepID=UPI001CF2DE3C|nr:Type 1 glutamine amidotransferase-like domain-containing protein [Clostridium sp. CS001]MCB2291627.1 Type 1 glutamine amidotransferase-like domain-containing protein [Clostridium sp. CS001]